MTDDDEVDGDDEEEANDTFLTLIYVTNDSG